MPPPVIDWLLPLAPATQLRHRRKKDHGRAEAMLLAAWGLGTRADVIASSLPPAALPEEETEGEDEEGAEWEAAFTELEGWRAGNPDAAWPEAPATLLGSWIKKQRQQYKAMAAGNATRAGSMTAALAARLEGLPNWEWAPRRGGSRRATSSSSSSSSSTPKLEGAQPAEARGSETPG